MSRSQNMELVQRINHAFTLLGKGFSSVEVMDALINQYGVSKVQAYRHLRRPRRGVNADALWSLGKNKIRPFRSLQSLSQMKNANGDEG